MNENSKIDNVIRLNVGGTAVKEGWKILNIQPGPDVDYIGDCSNMDQFSDQSISEIYASHVIEHLSYVNELISTLREINRTLVIGGVFKISVPDFEMLCRMFTHPSLTAEQRFYIMNVIFGGQQDNYDFHKVGLTWEFLTSYLQQAGFSSWKRVEKFNLFDNDCSSIRFGGQLISLNIEAVK